MTERKNLITSRQLLVVIIAAQVGVGIVSTPYEIAKEVGHDGWIATLIAGITTIAASIIWVLLLRRYKDKSIYEINKLLFGRIVGLILNLIFVLYLAYQVVFSIRATEETVHNTVLQLTPPIVLTILLLIPTIYIANNGFKPVCRYSGTVFITGGVVCLLLITNIQEVKPVFLMPVGQNLATPSMVGGVFTSIFEYYGFELTAVFYPHITDKKNTMKFIILASLISMLFYIFNTIVLTGFFGENMLRHEVFPLYTLARSYKAPIIERADLFFMVIWFLAMCATIKAFLYSAYYSIIKLFKIRKPTLLLMFFIAGMVILSLIPKDTQSLYSFERILNISGIAAAYIYPAVCYAFSYINKKGGQKKEKGGGQK